MGNHLYPNKFPVCSTRYQAFGFSISPRHNVSASNPSGIITYKHRYGNHVYAHPLLSSHAYNLSVVQIELICGTFKLLAGQDDKEGHGIISSFSIHDSGDKPVLGRKVIWMNAPFNLRGIIGWESKPYESRVIVSGYGERTGVFLADLAKGSLASMYEPAGQQKSIFRFPPRLQDDKLIISDLARSDLGACSIDDCLLAMERGSEYLKYAHKAARCSRFLYNFVPNRES